MTTNDMIRPELVCPAGTPASLRAAVDAGADAVYCGFQNATNARNFPGLNFTLPELEQGIAYAHGRGVKVLLAINSFPPAGATALWKQAVDDGVRANAETLVDLLVSDLKNDRPGLEQRVGRIVLDGTQQDTGKFPLFHLHPEGKTVVAGFVV